MALCGYRLAMRQSLFLGGGGGGSTGGGGLYPLFCVRLDFFLALSLITLLPILVGVKLNKAHIRATQ